MQEQYTPYEKNLMRKYQRDEITASIIYKNIAKREKNEKNKEVLLKISSEEHEHALLWERYLGEKAKPSRAKILCYGLMSILFGYTFVIKLMEKNEYQGIEDMRLLQDKISNINDIPPGRSCRYNNGHIGHFIYGGFKLFGRTRQRQRGRIESQRLYRYSISYNGGAAGIALFVIPAGYVLGGFVYDVGDNDTDNIHLQLLCIGGKESAVL